MPWVVTQPGKAVQPAPATRRVGADGESVAVAAVAHTIGVGWWSVMRAVADTALAVGEPT